MTGSTSPAEPIEPAIRAARVDDVEALVDIYLDSARHHRSIAPERYRVPDRGAARDRLRRVVDGQGDQLAYLVAEADGRVVGSLSVRAVGAPSAGSMVMPRPTAEIGIAVLAAWRGRGIGSALMAAGEAWARDHGFRRVVLDTVAGNAGAIRLYERLGYELAGLFLDKRLERP